MTIIDIQSTTEIPGEFYAYIHETPETAAYLFEQRTGQRPETIYSRTHSKLKFTTLYIPVDNSIDKIL